MRMCRELSRFPRLFEPTEPERAPVQNGRSRGLRRVDFDDMWKNGNLRDRYYMRYEALRA